MRMSRISLFAASLTGLLTGLGIFFTSGASSPEESGGAQAASDGWVYSHAELPPPIDVRAEASLSRVDAYPTSQVEPSSDHRSWVSTRQALLRGHKPKAEHLQPGDFAARFLYAYPEPTGIKAGVVAEAAPAPWDPTHHVVRIGVRAPDERDVAGMMQVYWNSQVDSWRLIGAGRRDADLTVLYEVRLSDARIDTLTLDIGRQQRTVRVEMADGFGGASSDYRVAVCAGALAEVLSDSPHLRGMSVRAVSVMARASERNGHPEDGELHELIAAARWVGLEGWKPQAHTKRWWPAGR